MLINSGRKSQKPLAQQRLPGMGTSVKADNESNLKLLGEGRAITQIFPAKQIEHF